VIRILAVVRIGSWHLAWPARIKLAASAVLALALLLVLMLQSRPRRLYEVEPGWLYRSGQLTPDLVERTLRTLDVDVIVDLTPDRGKRAAEVAAARSLGITWKNYELRGDGTGDISSYAGAIAAIDAAHRNGQRVLVHCYAGIRRTGGVLAAYLMLVEGASAQRGLAELQRFVEGESESVALSYLEEHLPELIRELEAQGVSVRSEPSRRLALLRQLMAQQAGRTRAGAHAAL
jgi:tyrosine-protein phosphatase SIW14